MAKDDGSGGNSCGCSCICDSTVARQFDQTSGRYNDRSAFANNAAQDAFNNMNSMFLAEAQNNLEKHGLADMLVQMSGAGAGGA